MGWACSTGSQALHQEGLGRHLCTQTAVSKGPGPAESIAQKKIANILLPPPPLSLLHSTSKGNVGLLLSIFLQTGAQASGGSLAKWLQRRRCVCVCGVCGGNLSTEGVVVFLRGSWAPAVPAPKKEPVEMVKINNNHHLKLLECVLFICYFIRSFQAPYEIGSLLSHFINKQTEAERVSALLTTHS